MFPFFLVNLPLTHLLVSMPRVCGLRGPGVAVCPCLLGTRRVTPSLWASISVSVLVVPEQAVLSLLFLRRS